MKNLILTLLATALLTGCGKSRPTYQLTIGGKTLDLIVHDDPKLIQDDLLSKVKPIWDELATGTSVTFQYQRIAPLDLGKSVEGKVKAKFGDNAKITSTQTTRGPVLRFFKNRNGDNGMERSADGKDFSAQFFGPGVDWEFVEHALRTGIFSIEDIRRSIQNDWTG